MDKLFGRTPVHDAVPTDRVLPLHFFEDSLLVQGNNMAVSLVFDEVLDPEKLRQALEGLVKREGWQRLGGRLRKNVRATTPTPPSAGISRTTTVRILPPVLTFTCRPVGLGQD